MTEPEQVEDLYRQLAIHRVSEAIEELRRNPPDCLADHASTAIEQAAAALACATAIYASPGGQVAGRLQDLITEMLASAASFEHLADFARHNARRRR